MQLTSTSVEIEKAGLPAPGFRYARNSLTYDDIHAVRAELSEFLHSNGIKKTHAGNLLLALTEILSNLVKHPPRPPDRLEITASLSGAQVDLEVADNSAPFADFDAKCKTARGRLDAAATGAESCYGLGLILTVCKRVQYISAEAGGGLNRFRISLNAADPQPDAARQCKKKIFLVDDDPISLQIHRCMLEDVYEVISFRCARDALAAFAQRQPDLIISDLNMPEMDGTALRHALSATGDGNSTPFIFLSGHSDKQDNTYINQLGVDDFLCKPVSRDRLHAVLARLLKRSQQVRTALHGQFSHDITELLKPALPAKLGPWRFITRYKVADAGGGDFILHHQAPTALMGVLADVMGHGRQAKFFSCVYAGYLHSLFRMYAGTLDIAHFLQYLSQSVDGDPLLESTIITCLCFHFLPEGIVKIASAGHPCPILLRGNIAEPVSIAGPLPGLNGDSTYDMKTLRLIPGDKIIFMTDGFLDAFDRRGLGAEELARRVQALACPSAAELSGALWREFEERREKQFAPKDDATIIIAEYGGNHEH